MPDLYDLRNIGGKRVYVVEYHHHVLLPWSAVRNEVTVAPNLITLDHHTDTHEPFLDYIYWNFPSSRSSQKERQLRRAGLISEARR
jgi:hypothetical protein